MSDDLTIRLWARFKRKDVKGEPGGAFRVGRTEKEGWYLAHVLQGHHDRTIFSIDWTGVSLLGSGDLQEGQVDLGMIATTGGDGKVCVFSIVSVVDPLQLHGHALICHLCRLPCRTQTSAMATT